MIILVVSLIAMIIGQESEIHSLSTAVDPVKAFNDIVLEKLPKTVTENSEAEIVRDIWSKLATDNDKIKLWNALKDINSGSVIGVRDKNDLLNKLNIKQKRELVDLVIKENNPELKKKGFKFDWDDNQEKKLGYYVGVIEFKDKNDKVHKFSIKNLPSDLKGITYIQIGKDYSLQFESSNGNNFFSMSSNWIEKSDKNEWLIKSEIKNKGYYETKDSIYDNTKINFKNSKNSMVLLSGEASSDEGYSKGIHMWANGHMGGEGIEVQIDNKKFFPHPEGTKPEGDDRNYAFVNIKEKNVYGLRGNVVSPDVGLVIYNTNEGVVDFTGSYIAKGNEQVISFKSQEANGKKYISGNAGDFAVFKLPIGVTAEFSGGESSKFSLMKTTEINEWTIVRTGQGEAEIYAQRDPSGNVNSGSGNTASESSSSGTSSNVNSGSGDTPFDFNSGSSTGEVNINDNTPVPGENTVPPKQQNKGTNQNGINQVLQQSDASKNHCPPGKGCSGGSCGPGGCPNPNGGTSLIRGNWKNW